MTYYFYPTWFIRPSPSHQKLYLNYDYNMKFYYPEYWMKIPGYEERYGFEREFFQISLLSGKSLSLDQIAQQEAFHQIGPYGSQPSIKTLNIQGQSARLILPSSDQPHEMMKQAAIIVTYPIPIQLSGKKYEYFILWADMSHIQMIIQSLQFLKQ
ncbi:MULTISPECIES: peptidase M56 [Bacillus cereus group]|uniref:Peptidase M56 n=1 Tax=Bacillus cereus TaxID=1396 RepID=A0A9W7QG25_BACCE|nr:peptidase M56 [Bacillus cereus]KAB2395334.1 peptidase M56 [Bacillus cereus]KAB2408088.1 peptidase M56 [Bacillus cereus]KAB2430953.1 peptidase M56 [Bacillus cereus]